MAGDLGTALGARTTDLNASERWGFVAFGDAGGIECAFDIDVVGGLDRP
jgi:hypothetical protein